MSRRQRRANARALYRANQTLREAIRQGTEPRPTASSSPIVTVSSDTHTSDSGDTYIHTSQHPNRTSGTDDAARRYDAARRADEASQRERERLSREGIIKAQAPRTPDPHTPDPREAWALASRVNGVGGASRPDCTKATHDPDKARAKRKAQAKARKTARRAKGG